MHNIVQFLFQTYSLNMVKNACWLLATKALNMHIDKDLINDLFTVAYDRKIFRPDQIFNLHSWALYRYGYSQNMPRYMLGQDLKYYRTYIIK